MINIVAVTSNSHEDAIGSDVLGTIDLPDTEQNRELVKTLWEQFQKEYDGGTDFLDWLSDKGYTTKYNDDSTVTLWDG